MRIWFLFLLTFILLTSCGTYSEKELQNFDQQIQDYIQKNGLHFEKNESGMYYNILNEGVGEEFIQYQDQVSFAYKGYFLDGNTFQVVDESDPLNLKVNQLIAGWQDALMMLKSQGIIQIILPPQLAYGKKHTELIPENSILVYDIKVLSIN
ncbi:MAG: FKBP-type peptidyl-prolyl cis-trans isomerase [Brumimicrobium sp.]|nr:FKBP-type peptidyl-prolyl cis-trans isomerase [Brumimicrobium sp.]